MSIDAIIAEAVASSAEQTPTTAIQGVENQQQAPEEITTEETAAQDEGAKTDDTPLPKKAVNAIRYRDNKLNKLKAEHQAALDELARFKAVQTPAPQQNNPQASNPDNLNNPDGSPNLDAYDKAGKTWEDFNEAKTAWKIQQALTDRDKKAEESQKNQELTKWADERSKVVDTRVQELATLIPDFDQTLEEIEDSIPALTPEIARIALEADDINLAVYALHKEGKLMDALNLPPARLAMEIAKAEIRGQQYLTQQKPAISKAPSPISAAKGTASGGKTVNDLKTGEFMKWLKTP